MMTVRNSGGYVRSGCLIILAGLLAGCSLWSSEDEIKPAELIDFQPQKTVSVLWAKDVGNPLGNDFHRMRPYLTPEQVYVADRGGRLTALERPTGRQIWQRSLREPLLGGVGADNARLFVTTRDGEVVALSKDDGSELWRATLSSESLSPVQSGNGLAIVQTIDGKLAALSSQDGSLRWIYDAQLPSLTLRGTSQPLFIGQRIYLGLANGKLLALDAANGEPLWETRVALPQGKTELERIVDIDGAIVEDDGLLYVTSYQGRIACVSARDGRILWAKELSSFHGAVKDEERLFTSDSDDAVVAHDLRSGGVIWRQSSLTNRRLGPPAILSGLVAVADFEGVIHFVSQTDGSFVARYNVDSSGVQGPMISDGGVLYILDTSGQLTALTLE